MFIEGDRAIVGAMGDDDNGIGSGSVYIFDWDGSNWIETKLLASDGAAHDRFGSSVSLKQDRVIVGAHQDDDNGFDSGSAYIFEWDGINWVENKLTASDGSAQDKFGQNVTIGENFAVAGSPQDDDNGSGSGSTYLFDISTCFSGIQVNTFIDQGNNRWNDPANWSLNEIPEACHEVVISDGYIAKILSGESAECYILDVKIGAVIEVVQGGTLNVLASN